MPHTLQISHASSPEPHLRESNSVTVSLAPEAVPFLTGATDLWSRVALGQMRTLGDSASPRAANIEAYCHLRDRMETYAEFITGSPNLNISWGIGSRSEIGWQAQTAYDIHQVLRYRLAMDQKPLPADRVGVSYSEPMKWGPETLPMPEMSSVESEGAIVEYRLCMSPSTLRVLADVIALALRVDALDVVSAVEVVRPRISSENIEALTRALAYWGEEARALNHGATQSQATSELQFVAEDLARALRELPDANAPVRRARGRR